MPEEKSAFDEWLAQSEQHWNDMKADDPLNSPEFDPTAPHPDFDPRLVEKFAGKLTQESILHPNDDRQEVDRTEERDEKQ